MKKTFVAAIVWAMTATSAVYSQHTQSLSFSGVPPNPIPTSGSTFNVSVNLTFDGYASFGLSYWLEAPNALAPFLSLTSVTYFTFPDPNQTAPNPAPFSSTFGSTSGFLLETRDLGGTVNDPTMKMIPPGTYHITDLTFTVAPGSPVGMFTIRSTTVSPRISEVTDTDFNDNNIIPAGGFVIRFGIPEPSTLSLLGLAIAGFGLMAYRRHNAAR